MFVGGGADCVVRVCIRIRRTGAHGVLASPHMMTRFEGHADPRDEEEEEEEEGEAWVREADAARIAFEGQVEAQQRSAAAHGYTADLGFPTEQPEQQQQQQGQRHVQSHYPGKQPEYFYYADTDGERYDEWTDHELLWLGAQQTRTRLDPEFEFGAPRIRDIAHCSADQMRILTAFDTPDHVEQGESPVFPFPTVTHRIQMPVWRRASSRSGRPRRPRWWDGRCHPPSTHRSRHPERRWRTAWDRLGRRSPSIVWHATTFRSAT